jgi:hypothetical protein
VKQPITAPTVGKLCFKFVRARFWRRFWRVGWVGRGEDRSGDLWELCSSVQFAVRAALCVEWSPFVSTTGDDSALRARFVSGCQRRRDPSHWHHKQSAMHDFIVVLSLMIDNRTAQTRSDFKS